MKKTDSLKLLGKPGNKIAQKPEIEHLMFYQFLLVSKSYEIAHQIRSNKLAKSETVPLDIDKVLRIYDLVGNIYSKPFEIWWESKGHQLFKEKTPISRLTINLDLRKSKAELLREVGDAISKGKVQTDPAIYNRLTEDSAYLAGLRPDQFVAFKAVLSDSDWHTLQSQRKALQNPATDKSPDNLDSAAVTTSVNNLLGQLQIPATGKDADPARLGAIRQYVNTTLLRHQGNEGKHFTEKDIGSRISDLFTQTAFTKHFWSPDNNETVLAKNIGDIPDAIKTKIKAAFVKKGIDNPTDGQILGSYFNGMSK